MIDKNGRERKAESQWVYSFNSVSDLSEVIDGLPLCAIDGKH